MPEAVPPVRTVPVQESSVNRAAHLYGELIVRLDAHRRHAGPTPGIEPGPLGIEYRLLADLADLLEPLAAAPRDLDDARRRLRTLVLVELGDPDVAGIELTALVDAYTKLGGDLELTALDRPTAASEGIAVEELARRVQEEAWTAGQVGDSVTTRVDNAAKAAADTVLGILAVSHVER